jgi:hypothetical protein
MIDSQLFTVQPVTSHHITDGIDLYIYNSLTINTNDEELSLLIYEKLAEQLNLTDHTSIFPASSITTFMQPEYIKSLGKCYTQYLDSIDFSSQTVFLVINKQLLSPGFFIPRSASSN